MIEKEPDNPAGFGGVRIPTMYHEYKKEHDSSNDPLGQLMIRMVAARQLNADNHSVYGAYVMGRYWHFVVLHEQNYAVHTGLNAADVELFHIFGVLKNTKKIIGEWGRSGESE
jgi:hypothetical protein